MYGTRRALPRSTCVFGADWSRAICEASAGKAIGVYVVATQFGLDIDVIRAGITGMLGI